MKTSTSVKEWVQWYRSMLRIRIVEEEIAKRYAEQQMRCPVHLCIGEEAIAVGVCSALTHRDYAFGNHRSHGHYLAKGGALKPLLAEIYGKATGCCGGLGGSMHLIDLAVGFMGATPIVGSTIPIAVGAALGSAMRGEKRVVVTFFGDGAVEEGVFHEALNFASLKKLPVLFVCENNLYSVYSPLSVRQPHGREIYRLAEGHGVKSVQSDGNDIAEVVRLASEAVQRAHAGEGPTFLEFKTYRYRDHVGPDFDNSLGYRGDEEFKAWAARDPIKHLNESLVKQGVLSQQTNEAIVKEIKAEVAEAFVFALSSPFPSQHTNLLDSVYAKNGTGSVSNG